MKNFLSCVDWDVLFRYFAERKEQDSCEVDGRFLRSRRRGEDQAAGHEVPTRILSPKRSGEFFITKGSSTNNVTQFWIIFDTPSPRRHAF